MNELQIMNIKGVSGYVDADGMAWLDLEDVARGLDITKTDRKNGTDYKRINRQALQKWLCAFGILNSEKDELPEYIAEPVFYLLSMKAENETARAFQYTIAYDILPSIRRKGYYSVLPDEQLAKALISALGDEWKLENVIIPALRQGYDEQGVLVAKYMGMDIDDLLKNSKLMKKSSENHLAKTRIAKWFGAAFTMNDIPEEFEDTPEVFMAIAKTRKKCGCDEWFADYCGETYFNLYAYEEIIDYLKNCGVVTPEYADKWKREIKLESAGRKKVIP